MIPGLLERLQIRALIYVQIFITYVSLHLVSHKHLRADINSANELLYIVHSCNPKHIAHNDCISWLVSILLSFFNLEKNLAGVPLFANRHMVLTAHKC